MAFDTKFPENTPFDTIADGLLELVCTNISCHEDGEAYERLRGEIQLLDRLLKSEDLTLEVARRVLRDLWNKNSCDEHEENARQ